MTGRINLSIEGCERVMSVLSVYVDPEKVLDTFDEVMTKCFNGMANDLRDAAPYKTGNYRRSIRWDGGKGYWQVGTDSRLAQWLEFGTGIRGEFPTKMYKIAPRYKKALRFQSELGFSATLAGIRGRISGQTTFKSARGPTVTRWITRKSKTHTDVFAKWVMHPGIRPFPHFRPVFIRWQPIIKQELLRALKALLAKTMTAGFYERVVEPSE